MNNSKRNSVWLASQYLVSIVFALITLKLNLMTFGKNLFGVWILISSFWGLGSALDLGFGIAIIKYTSEYKNDLKRLNNLLSSSFIVFFLLGLSVLLIMSIVGYISYFMGNVIPQNFQNEGFYIFIILGITFLFRYITIFFRSFFEGMNNFVLTSKFMILYNLLIFFSVIIIYLLKFQIIALALVYLFSTIILNSLFVLTFIFKYKEYKIKVKLFNFAEIKRIFAFSSSVQLTSIFGALLDPVLKFIIASFYLVEFVSVYEIARRFAIAISGLFFNAFRTVLPKTSVLTNKEDYNHFFIKEGFKTIKFGGVYSIFTFGAASIFIVMFIKYFYQSEEAVIVFFMLSLPEAINCYGYVFYMFIIGIGKAYIAALIQFFNLLLISLFTGFGFYAFNNSIGLMGFFIAILIVNIFTSYYVLNLASFDFKMFFKEANIFRLTLLLLSLLAAVFLAHIQIMDSLYIALILSLLMLILNFDSLKVIKNLIFNFRANYQQ